MEVADDVDDVDAVKRSIIITINTGINVPINKIDVGDRQLMQLQIGGGTTLFNANYTPQLVQAAIKKVDGITDMNLKYNEIIDKIFEEYPRAAQELRRSMSENTETINLDSITDINNEIKGILNKISEPNLVILEDLFGEVEDIMTSISAQPHLLFEHASDIGGYGTPPRRNRNTSPPARPRKGGSKKRKSKKRKSKKRKSKKRKSKKRKSKKK